MIIVENVRMSMCVALYSIRILFSLEKSAHPIEKLLGATSSLLKSPELFSTRLCMTVSHEQLLCILSLLLSCLFGDSCSDSYEIVSLDSTDLNGPYWLVALGTVLI